MGVFRAAIIWALVAFFAFRIAILVSLMGFHKTVYNHRPGACQRIESLTEGSEDMELIPGDKVLITTGLRFISRHNEAYKDRFGRVFMLDLNAPDDAPQLVQLKDYTKDPTEADFHGLSSWVNNETGEVRVFIVNHAADDSVVDVFTYNYVDNTLTFIKSCGQADPNFHVLNDVVAVGEEEFYVTDFAYWRHHGLYKLETIFMMRLGSILYWSGGESHVLVKDLVKPNGINRSPDGRYIYIFHMGGKEIMVFERQKNNELLLRQSFPIYSLGDNIVVDNAGNLWIGSHSIGYKVLLYLEDHTIESPSQVLRLTTQDGLITGMTEEFSDDGRLISGSSVALYAKNRLLIGSVYTQTVICHVPE